jgi:tryptophan synthase beta subunit
MGKRKVIAETGAGQHGVATATVAALLVCNAIFLWGPRISDVSLSMFFA